MNTHNQAPASVKDRYIEKAALALIMVGWYCICGAMIAVTAKCYVWLRNGSWPDWSLKGLGLAPPLTHSYYGLNKIIVSVYEGFGPTALAFWVGILLIYTATRLPSVKYREK